MDFLSNFDLRPIQKETYGGHAPKGYFLGETSQGMGAAPEVLLFELTKPVDVPILRKMYKERLGGRALPLIVVVLTSAGAQACVHAKKDPCTYSGIDRHRLERTCEAVLKSRDPEVARRLIRDALPDIEDAKIFGLRNSGYLSTRVLVRDRQNRQGPTRIWSVDAWQARATRSIGISSDGIGTTAFSVWA